MRMETKEESEQKLAELNVPNAFRISRFLCCFASLNLLLAHFAALVFPVKMLRCVFVLVINSQPFAQNNDNPLKNMFARRFE